MDDELQGRPNRRKRQTFRLGDTVRILSGPFVSFTGKIEGINQDKALLKVKVAKLYEALADYYFRSNHRWSAKGEAIPRILKRVDADLCSRFCSSFDELFSNGQSERVIALVEELLEANGGFLFDGHRLEAPLDHRKPLTH